jgi:hypothetical protein
MEDGEIFYSYMFDYWDQWFTQADAGRGNPSANPTCAPDADLAQLSPPPLLSVGERQRSPRDVLYDIRHVMCTNKCEAPDGYPPKSAKFEKKGANGCELSVLLSSNIEAYAVRESELVGPGPQVDDCWASFDNITHKCIDPIGPNKRGLVEGPDQGERFEMGYRKKNGGNKLHSDFQE